MTEDDEDLLAALRRVAAGADPVPDVVAASARAAFETRRLDEQLLELLHDSDLATATTRGPTDGPRLLSYEWGDVSLELQLRSSDDGVSLRGVVVGSSGDVRLEPAHAAPAVAAPDDHGWFTATLPPAPFRVRVTTSTGMAVSTGWISL